MSPSTTVTLARSASTLSRRPVAKLSMTTTSWSAAASRSTRCEPMNPAPPVISTFISVSSVGHEPPEVARTVVIGLLPELQREQAPGPAAEPALRDDPVENLAVVDQRAAARGLGPERIVDELARRAAHPLGQRHREAHLVLALDDLAGQPGRYRPLEDVLEAAVAELDVGGDRRRELDDPVVEQRDARLEPVRHRHAVLDLQQRRQQRLEVEVGHLVEVGLVADVAAVEDALERRERRVVAECLEVDRLVAVAHAVDQPEVAG